MVLAILLTACNSNLSVSEKSDELLASFEEFTKDKTITIATLKDDLSELLDKEIDGDFFIAASSNNDGQYLATFDVYDLPKGSCSLGKAQEIARNVVYYICAAKEKYDLPILYAAFSIMEKDSSHQLIVTGLGSEYIESAPKGSWSETPMKTKDFIEYIQNNYDLGTNSEGKAEYSHRAFYKDANWKR